MLNIPKKSNLAANANPFVTVKKQDEATKSTSTYISHNRSSITTSSSPQKQQNKSEITKESRPGSTYNTNPQLQNDKKNHKNCESTTKPKSSSDETPSLNSLQKISESYCDTDSSNSNPSSPSQRKSPPLSPSKSNKKNATSQKKEECLTSSTPHKSEPIPAMVSSTTSSKINKSDISLNLDASAGSLSPSKAKQERVLTDQGKCSSRHNNNNSSLNTSSHNKSGSKHKHHHHTTLSRNSIWSPVTKGVLQHKIFFNRHNSSSSHGSSSTTSSTTTSPTKHEATTLFNGESKNSTNGGLCENRVIKTVSGM